MSLRYLEKKHFLDSHGRMNDFHLCVITSPGFLLPLIQSWKKCSWGPSRAGSRVRVRVSDPRWRPVWCSFSSGDPPARRPGEAPGRELPPPAALISSPHLCRRPSCWPSELRGASESFLTQVLGGSCRLARVNLRTNTLFWCWPAPALWAPLSLVSQCWGGRVGAHWS